MSGQLSYSLERDEYVEALGAVVSNIAATAAHRGLELRYVVALGVYIAVWAAYVAIVWRYYPDMWAAAGEAIAFFIIIHLLALAAWDAYWKWTDRSRLGVTFDARRHRNMTAAFDDEAAHFIGPEIRQSWTWSALRAFHELPTVYVLEFLGHEMLVVPRRAFASADDAETWAAGIRGRV